VTAWRREYFEPVISTSRLKASLVGDRVVFDERGEPIEVEVPTTIGPAALLVSSVTDAVKRVVEGRIESLDRDGVWAVEAIVLNQVVLRRLEDDEMTPTELLARVRELGYAWEINPVSGP
jgi:hypothetical protein